GLLSSMVRLFLAKDCSLVEINPLVVTDSGHLLCLDAKINFDDNALYRHPDIVLLRDIEQEDAKEYRASQFDLNYVSLDGDIGCMVNGAGLAMATMDIIKNFGGKPANFLDVGGSATAERVKAAFEILLSDTNVKAIFVNIFGGIMKCDVIAQGVVAAVSEMGISIPLVVRLEGTNVELGRRILNDSGLSIVAASDMADGARKAIALAKEAAR
ncbi:MAG: succinate--CoA ligase subunit beta, partial [Sphaerochaetaceae bacterium]|nr:succinate--CoA ligase subunit beta [Sphaerochaetaceae bacterium]